MKRASRFSLPANWELLLSDMQIDTVAVLNCAGLPADLFKQEHNSLTANEYFSLWNAIETVAGSKDVPLLVGEHLSVEAFDPPIFAALCSPNLNVTLTRLRDYKPLIGPMLMTVSVGKYTTSLTMECYGNTQPIPSLLGASELIFITQLARIATRSTLKAVTAELPVIPGNSMAYGEFLGCTIQQGNKIRLGFTAEDAAKPFMTANAGMWDFFEEKLNQRLHNLHSQASITERVRAVLLETLPSGESSIDTIAKRLCISKRTLQRKLTEEAESYQALLQRVRTELADHYLDRSRYTLGEISFMLGFQDVSSFVRAYQSWKGVSPGKYRENMLS